MADYEVVPNLDPRARYGGFSADVGGGHSVVFKAPSPSATTAPASHTPPQMSSASGGWPEGRAVPEHAGPSHGPSWAASPVYIWMAALALYAGSVVSGSPFGMREGLHLHPVYGIAAGFAVIGLYRYLMTWFPTAVLVTLASTFLWAILLWVSRHASELRDVPTEGSQASLFLATLATRFQRSMLIAPDPWVAGLAAAALALHLLYWRHRRTVAAEQGWLFNRGIANAARTLGALAVASAALGFVIRFFAYWSR